MILRRLLFILVSYSIGLIGGGFPWEPLMTFSDLVRDALILRSMGAPKIVVFVLSPELLTAQPDFIRQFTQAVNDPPNDTRIAIPFSRPVSLIFFGVFFCDALLDLSGSQKHLGLSWIIISFILLRRKS